MVLCIGGQDPSGGAGIQADAEAVAAVGAHACCVVTCLTTQDSCGVRRIYPVPAEHLIEQCALVLDDSRVAAIKIGLVGSSRSARAIAAVIDANQHIPTILDPVLASGAGERLADAALRNQVRKNLISRSTLVTPNAPEARCLTDRDTLHDCAAALMELGCNNVLITGTHTDEEAVINRLWRRGKNLKNPKEWTWPRLEGEFHGSGCTLASAIAAHIALGEDLTTAVQSAQTYAWETLARARRTGRCQLTPHRLFAMTDGTSDDA